MNVRTISSVPLRLRPNQRFAHFLRGRTEIRGEIVMYKDEFMRLNKEREALGETLFKNPRNLAAGTIRQLDPTLVAARPLHFVGYDIIRDSLRLGQGDPAGPLPRQGAGDRGYARPALPARGGRARPRLGPSAGLSPVTTRRSRAPHYYRLDQ